MRMESMEVDEKTNGWDLRPVGPDEVGEGLPYAPVWPKPGDVWSWKVGKRITSKGHYVDRYLYPPRHLGRSPNEKHPKKRGLPSKLSVERFIRSLFPNADVEAFFASFSWKIPAKMSTVGGNLETNVLSRFEEAAESSESEFQPDEGASCKAGNKNCSSLVAQKQNPSLGSTPCDICCSEPRFCPDCCCILCCKTINPKHSGFSYIKCEAVDPEGYICGHVAHIDCGLRTYMAGTVGGSIGLDVEYYCRRCDARTDLIPHVRRFIQICEAVDSCEDVEEILNLGICVMRGSRKIVSGEMLSQFQSALAKLKSGANIEDIWEGEDALPAISTGRALDFCTASPKQDHSDNKTTLPDALSSTSEFCPDTLQLEDEIDQTLYELKKSQDSEYSIAEEQLYAQKNHIRNLYQQLKRERFELAQQTSNAKRDVLQAAATVRENQIKKEVEKLRSMEAVAKGFGRTSKRVLNEYFGLVVDE